MAATAEKVTPIEEGKDLVQFGKALVKFDIKEQVIQDLEEATRLEITDAASEKVVRKHRQNAKSIQVRIEKTRLQLNREFKEKTDEAAALIAPRVTAAYDKLDEKVKVIEAEREARKAEKEEVERLRLGKIQWLMDGLECDCAKGLEYNLCAEEIMAALTWLKEIEISAVDYEERTEEAEHRLASAIIGTEAALENRKKFEADQAEASRIKAENEAKEKELAEQQAKIDAEEKRKVDIQKNLDLLRADVFVAPGQAKSTALNSSLEFLQEYTLNKDVYQERFPEAETMLQAAMTDCENRLRVALDREELEAEKARLAEEQYQRDWDEALEINLGMIHEHAIAEHEQYKRRVEIEIEACRAGAQARWLETMQAQEETATRAKLVEPDKAIIAKVAKDLEQAIADHILYEDLKTKEGQQLYLDLIAGLRAEVHKFELGGLELV